MHYIDTHSHFYREYYPDDFSDAIKRAMDCNVSQIILPCVTVANVSEIFEATDLFPENLFPLIGLHPTEVKQNYIQELTTLEPFLKDSRVVGIGECGIDLYWDKGTLEEQKIAFTRQLEWAKEYHLPLSLHVRDAYAETIDILKKYVKEGITGILHCFSGGIEEAKWAINHGFLLGIGGIITFKNNKLQSIIKEIGLQYLTLETDAPFLAPVPHRGTTNESSYIPLIADKIAEIFETSSEEVMNITTQNAWNIFTKLPH
ncbi:MAG: TatD family hydrolase [Bacteroidales bacterium]|jgi:TatD DNase family protein|nr:TatD family hydrolase [Bacteroidales bacterium]